MKKIFILLATFGLCLVSCNKITVVEDNTFIDGEGMQMVTIKANIGEQTKTSYADDPNNTGIQLLSWAVGDEISVRCSDGKYYTLAATSSGASTYFSGTIPANVSIRDIAYFPADANHADERFSIAKEKDMTAHPSADLPMVGTKGADGVFTFSHCSGAARLTFDNIPDDITSVKITIENASLNLSGRFTLYKGAEAGLYYYEPKGKDSEGHEKFIRTVSVSDNTAQVYLPYSCASGTSMWATSTLSIVGYKADQSSVTLLNSKTIPSLGAFSRAHVKPLKTLVISHLSLINWTDSGVFTSTLDPTSSKKCLSELKVTSDSYFMYAKVTAPVAGYSGDYLDIMLSDGDVNGTHYSLSDDNQYWTTAGDVVYREQHKGSVTTESLTMSFNGQSIDTKTENDGTNIYWYMAFPRSAHSLLSSQGTVYVAFMLWNGWGCAGAIPTRYTAMLPVTLP